MKLSLDFTRTELITIILPREERKIVLSMLEVAECVVFILEERVRLENIHLVKFQLRHDGTGKDATAANRNIRALLK